MTTQPVWLTREQMQDICPSCAQYMQEQKITKVKVLDEDGQFTFLKAGFSQGLCDKFGGATGFRTRCMSTMSGKVSDEGAFCNSLKIYCHGSASAESKRGKILEKDASRRYTLGIVYAPHDPDTDDEFTDEAELEKAAWDFMRELQGRGEAAKAAVDLVKEICELGQDDGLVTVEATPELEEIVKRGVNAMHLEDLQDAEVVESYLAPVDMEIDGQKVSKGTWLVGIVWDHESFKKIETGEWTGYSMGGYAHRLQ